MLDTIFGLDAWLRQHGFQPCAEPGSARVTGLHAGVSLPGLADFWYRGSYGSSVPFSLRISFMPVPALHITGYIQIESAGSESDNKQLESHSQDFSRELRTYVASLSTKPSA
jgi:hypothetical protein